MKKIIIPATLFLTLPWSTMASADCFLIKKNNQPLQQSGQCQARHSPCSTFKVAISLMGFDQHFLKDAQHPKLPYKKGYPDYIERWRQPQTPTSWIANSCLWYSQVITNHLGEKKFTQYIKKFHYGNENISGDPGQYNGLTNAWLSSSLQISPKEQFSFIEALAQKILPISQTAQDMTRQILFVHHLPDGWKLYGKTGSCTPSSLSHEPFQFGWFIGWIEKQNQHITFVQYLEDKAPNQEYAGPRAKKIAIRKLLDFIKNTN